MNLNWSLDELYTSLTSLAFIGDLEKATLSVSRLKSDVSSLLGKHTAATTQTVEDLFGTFLELEVLLSNLFTYVNLRLSVNTDDHEALKFYERLEHLQTELTEPQTIFDKAIGAIEDLGTFVSTSALLTDHLFILSEIKAHSLHLLPDGEEVILSKMATTGSSAWANLWGKLTSSVEVNYELDDEVKTMNLSSVRNMAYLPDSRVRKAAYEAELQAYLKIDAATAACLNGIKGEVITISNLRGYTSPLEKTLQKSRLTQKALDAMMASMTDYLPHFRRYFKEKARLLGHTDGLPFYDLFAPMGKSTKSFTYDEARTFIIDNFSKFSQNMADFATHAFDHGWIDVEPVKGKVGGAFCQPVYGIGQSRILLNFSGDLGGVTTIAHELGHGYHNTHLFKESILNTHEPMVLAETASTFCETIVADAIIRQGGEDAFVMLETSLQGSSQVVVDIMSRYLFESRVFATRADHSLSVDEFKETMLGAQRDAYGDGLNPDTLHPYMWACKPHYYDANESFYNFPYAFGLLFAKGLYARYLAEGPDFIQKYDDMLRISGKMSVKDVCTTMGIDVEDRAFWDASLELIRHEIDSFIELAKNR